MSCSLRHFRFADSAGLRPGSQVPDCLPTQDVGRILRQSERKGRRLLPVRLTTSSLKEIALLLSDSPKMLDHRNPALATMSHHEKFLCSDFAVVCLASACVPQTEKWMREDKTDPLRSTNHSVFYIEGKFLTPPQKATDDTPRFFVKCVPGGHKRVNGGYINGKLLAA